MKYYEKDIVIFIDKFLKKNSKKIEKIMDILNK